MNSHRTCWIVIALLIMMNEQVFFDLVVLEIVCRVPNFLQASGYPGVTVPVEDIEDNEDNIGDGGETVALSIQENNSSFMDDFFKQVMFSVYVGCV